MMDIRLDRTFWPVGHGAFYTERFYDHKDGRIFTAIYDCGSGRRWRKTQNGTNDASPKTVQQMIEGFLPSQKDSRGNLVKDIDIAFVSHLHVDHINGLPTLLPRIKKLVLPHLSDCRLLEAFLYNAIPEGIRAGEVSVDAIEDEGRVDVEGEVQTFVLRLARGEVENTVQVIQNEGELVEEPIQLENLNREIRSGSSIRVPLSQRHNAFWIYKPVDVDGCSEDIRKAIVAALQQYVTTGNILVNDKIDWSKVQEAVNNAGLKAVIAIYEKVFGITVSSQHNNYSMPVYSGPDEFRMAPLALRYTDVRIETTDARGYIHSRYEIDSHPFHVMQLGVRCRLLSCLYMGDFNAKDDHKFEQLQEILGVYYNLIGLQQVPHHFSDGNHRPELYKGPLFAFGNISSLTDKSFSQATVDDIRSHGCDPLIITRQKYTGVRFRYDMILY